MTSRFRSTRNRNRHGWPLQQDMLLLHVIITARKSILRFLDWPVPQCFLQLSLLLLTRSGDRPDRSCDRSRLLLHRNVIWISLCFSSRQHTAALDHQPAALQHHCSGSTCSSRSSSHSLGSHTPPFPVLYSSAVPVQLYLKSIVSRGNGAVSDRARAV